MKIEGFYPHKNEKPLDQICENGGACCIFRKIAVIGDSLASGEFDSVQKNQSIVGHDIYEHSWGQYLGRMCGSVVYNFSRGNMTAMEFCETFADENDYWNEKYSADAYIIALGVNDLCNYHHPVGDLSDICTDNWRNNKKSFIGYYAQIIQRYREISPKSKVFLMTMPEDVTRMAEGQREWSLAQVDAIKKIQKRFSQCWLIDLNKYGPVYDDEFHDRFFMGGHMSPYGYYLTACMVSSYIDYIIRNDPASFQEVGYIRTPWQYDETDRYPFPNLF